MSAFMGTEEVLMSEDPNYAMDTEPERREYFSKIMERQRITGLGKRLYLEYLLSVKKSEAFLIREQDIRVLEGMIRDEKAKATKP